MFIILGELSTNPFTIVYKPTANTHKESSGWLSHVNFKKSLRDLIRNDLKKNRGFMTVVIILRKQNDLSQSNSYLTLEKCVVYIVTYFLICRNCGYYNPYFF